MIEIVYDKTTAEKNGKNEIHYKMPKNIRQIGNAPTTEIYTLSLHDALPI